MSETAKVSNSVKKLSQKESQVSRIEIVPLMRETAVKRPPNLTPLINMSQSRGFEGGQTITIIANDDEEL